MIPGNTRIARTVGAKTFAKGQMDIKTYSFGFVRFFENLFNTPDPFL